MEHPIHIEKTVKQLARPPVFEPAGKQDWNLLSKSLYSKGFSASV
jgi:hypothetical protein